MVLVSLLCGALVGCGNVLASLPSALGSGSFSGLVTSGGQPVRNAQVQLYTANAGSGALNHALLHEPVSTGADGSFKVPAGYTCPSSDSPVYLVATGGLSSSQTSANLASAWMTELGNCGDLSTVSGVEANELTTVAFVSALAPFMQSTTSVGTGATDMSSLNDAFASAQDLVAEVAMANANPTLPPIDSVQKIVTLADIQFACNATSGGAAGDGTPCGNLFTYAKSDQGVAPQDSATAMLYIAKNPTNNVTLIYSLKTEKASFQPMLASAPKDWDIKAESKLSQPVFSPQPGTYSGPQTITLTHSAAGAQIYYNTDGTWQPYTGAIVLPSSKTIQAIAVAKGMSLVASGAYNIAGPSLSVSVPTTVNVGQTGTGTVSLSTAAPQGGAVITLTSSAPATVLVKSAVLNVAAGKSSASFTYQGVATGSATLSASAAGYTAGSAQISTAPVVVSLPPASVSLLAWQSHQFTATVTGASNTGVVWSVSPAIGSISAYGYYMAPASISLPETVTVTATSVADSTKYASATVDLVAPISVTLTPGSVSLWQTQSQAFTTTVSGTTNTSVKWTLNPAVGSISTSGVYTAPATVSTAQSVTVTATSAADSTKQASATVKLVPPVAVSLPSASVSLAAWQSHQFTATVTNTSNTNVVWSVSPAVGSISAYGYYMAPSSISLPQTVTVTATSVADSTKYASATLELVPPVSVTLTPGTVSLSQSQSQGFTATVVGTTNTPVKWTLSPAVGSISTSGVYTAPATISTAQSVTVTATSAADSTKQASATVKLVPPVALSLNPGSVSLGPSQTQAFAATVTNSSNAGVVWSLSPAVGSISAAGVYTAPSSISTNQTVTVTATSVADTTKSATATVALTPSSVIPATYFGLTVLNFTQLTPSMSFGTTRSWDAWPGLDWSDANPAAGVYNFSYLDQFMAINEARGAEMIYTFGRTPQWASSQPNNVNSPYGPGECAPPANMSNWDAYVTAIATHAAGRIKYWELWNEPNEATYCGDMPTMVTMAQHAARIIKGIDPTALILSPSPDKASGPAWLSSFLSGGGASAVDVIAFHGYWSSTAEDILTVVSGFRTVMAANGVSSLPIWDTESSWAYTSDMPLPSSSAQVGYLAKSYLLHWSAGVPRFAWYAYDGESPWGTLWTPGTGETPAARAYSQTYSWMVGATLTAPCSQSASVWSCSLSRSGGYSAEAVWISGSSAQFAVPARYTQYRDLAGVVHPVSNGFVTIGDQPILLETGTAPTN